MAGAENDEVKRRVEKVSIALRTVLIEQSLEGTQPQARDHLDSGVSRLPPGAYSGIESELREVFRLYERYGVDHFAEGSRFRRSRRRFPRGLRGMLRR